MIAASKLAFAPRGKLDLSSVIGRKAMGTGMALLLMAGACAFALRRREA